MGMPQHAEVGDDVNPLDVVWGAEGVAPIIKRSERQARYLLKAGIIPSRRVGRSFVTTRGEIIAALLGPAQPREAA